MKNATKIVADLVAGACNHLDFEFPWSVAELPAAS